MARINDTEWVFERPRDDDRLLATRLYEEHSPLEMVRDAELGVRVSEMLDCAEDEATITWWAEKARI